MKATINNNLLFLASSIEYHLIEAIQRYNTYDECVAYAVGEIMRRTKGIVSPDFIKQMIYHHRYIFEANGFTDLP